MQKDKKPSICLVLVVRRQEFYRRVGRAALTSFLAAADEKHDGDETRERRGETRDASGHWLIGNCVCVTLIDSTGASRHLTDVRPPFDRQDTRCWLTALGKLCNLFPPTAGGTRCYDDCCIHIAMASRVATVTGVATSPRFHNMMCVRARCFVLSLQGQNHAGRAGTARERRAGKTQD